MGTIISLIGLILDIIGVVLLFIYGLPSKIIPDNVVTIHNVYAADDDNSTTEEKERNKRIKIGAYSGLSLLIIGFAFQATGSLINSPFIQESEIKHQRDADYKDCCCCCCHYFSN